MQKKIFALYALLFYGVCISQNSISGKVYSVEATPVVGSHVHIGNKSVSSDVNGAFVIKNLPKGMQKVNVSCVGYKPIDTIVNVVGNIQINFVLKLKKKPKQSE